MNITSELLIFFVTLFGYLEIFYKIYILYFLNIFITFIHNKKENVIHFIKNNKIQNTIYLKDYNKDTLLNYDFAYTQSTIDNNVCIFFVDAYNNNKFELDDIFLYNSDKFFLSVDVTIHGKNYSLDINNYNFFFKNNILFKNQQIHFLLKKFFNIISDDSYTINIVDNNCNIVSLDSNQFIFLNEKTYHIVNV